MINETLFYSPSPSLPHFIYLSIRLSIHICIALPLSLYLLPALSDTRLESEVRNDRCSRPAVYTERDETLMQRGSLVRARNFGFPVYRRRLAAHIRCVCRCYELRGSARRSLVSFPPLAADFTIEISSRESKPAEGCRLFSEVYVEISCPMDT